jgi:hypothetical protein
MHPRPSSISAEDELALDGFLERELIGANCLVNRGHSKALTSARKRKRSRQRRFITRVSIRAAVMFNSEQLGYLVLRLRPPPFSESSGSSP